MRPQTLLWNRRESNPQTSALPAQRSPVELRPHHSLLTNIDRIALNKIAVYANYFLLSYEILQGCKESNPVIAGLESAAVPPGTTPTRVSGYCFWLLIPNTQHPNVSGPVWMSRPGRFSGDFRS